MGRSKASDATAQGVAKIRHIETIWPTKNNEQRLFEDPFAKYLYKGSSIVGCLPMRWLFSRAPDLNTGLFHLLVGRTREFDEQVHAGVAAGIKQIVILGAGYDTRGFRLDISDSNVTFYELDQPDVQEKKKAGLDAIKKRGIQLPNERNVKFVPCDFNVETVEKLREVPGYDPAAATLFIMEGVTQYIPKEATAGSLKTAASVCGAGSRVLVSYVPQELWDDPVKCFYDPPKIQALLGKVESIGEPWVSGWTKESFADFLSQCGFTVQRDVSIHELVREYFVPAGRVVPEKQQALLERYAMATK